MKITWMKLSNYRCFSDLEINFHPKLTVIVAQNGQGKTTILDAVSTALGPYLGAFPHGVGRSISVSDARYHRKGSSLENEQVYPVVVKGNFLEPTLNITRELTSSKSRTTSKDARALSDYAAGLNQKLMDLENVNLPVVASYGCGRLWNAHKNMDRKSVLSTSRSMGYEDATTPASSFTQVQQWMSKATFAALQQEQMDIYEDYKITDQIRGIQAAVDCVLETASWSKLHYSFSHEELAMSHPEFGVLPVSLLSDGVRAMVSMVADLAWRCSKLNPHLGAQAPVETTGVVAIDEVDMHLHPDWQQKIISDLQRAFPKLQFIVTTHSPQVISTVEDDCLRILSKGTVHTSPKGTRGAESSRILDRVFDVRVRPPEDEITKMLKSYEKLVFNDEWNTIEADKLRSALDKAFAGEEPKLTELDEYIENRKWERGIEEDS